MSEEQPVASNNSRKRITITLPQYLADHLQIWAGVGEPAPDNEVQSIQAWLGMLADHTKEEVADIMRKRMLLLIRAATAIHDAGPEIEDAYAIYKNVSREHMREKLDNLRLHRQLASERLRADSGWERYEAKNKECLALREQLAEKQ
jgi:hypothetical protein